MIGNDDDLVAVPNFGVFAELLLEHADRARPANVMRHEDVGIHPDVVARLHTLPAGVAGQDAFGHGHGRHELAPKLVAQGVLQVYDGWAVDKGSSRPPFRFRSPLRPDKTALITSLSKGQDR
jgi:hypothetical protein